jgi:hypothetical protein
VRWTDAVAGFTAPDAERRIRPSADSVAVYARRLPDYEALEARARVET